MLAKTFGTHLHQHPWLQLAKPVLLHQVEVGNTCDLQTPVPIELRLETDRKSMKRIWRCSLRQSFGLTSLHYITLVTEGHY